MRTGPPLRHGVAAYGDEIVSVLRIVQRTGTKGDNVLRRYAVLRNVSACALAKPDDSGTTNTAEPVGIGQDVRPEIRRSEERRVGKESVSPCRSRWSRYH